MRFALTALAVVTLSACSQSGPDHDVPAIRKTSAPTPPPVPAQAGQPEIPERFRGVWDYVEGNCDPASDLRMTVLPREIEFYESHGRITGVMVGGPDIVTVELAMEGEGETWTMQRRFTLTEGGNRLIPEALGDDQFEPMPLKRCEV